MWARIAEAGTRPHPIYAAGMPRLSCRFCVLASRSALVLAARLDPDGAERRAAMEQRMGHTFRKGLPMRDIIAEAKTARRPGGRRGLGRLMLYLANPSTPAVRDAQAAGLARGAIVSPRQGNRLPADGKFAIDNDCGPGKDGQPGTGYPGDRAYLRNRPVAHVSQEP